MGRKGGGVKGEEEKEERTTERRERWEGRERRKGREERREEVDLECFQKQKTISARLELTSPATSALEFLHMSLEKREIMGSSLPNVKGCITR